MTRLLVLLCLLGLAVPTAADARRRPTKSEKTRIARAAHRSRLGHELGCFTVDHVKVSTKGPWASATLRSCEDQNAAIFGLFSHKRRWKLRRTGNGSVGCDIAPRRVQRDLRLGCG